MPTENNIKLAGDGKKSAFRLSKDGKWRSFPKAPRLLQYVSSGSYYARIHTGGKIIRKSLETTVWSTAQMKLVDFLKNQQTPQTAEVSKNEPKILFSEAVEIYKRRTENNTAMKSTSKHYRAICLRKIETSCPSFWKLSLHEISSQCCLEWAIALQKTIASQYFNNVAGTLRLIIEGGIKEQIKRGGKKIENPAGEIARAKIPQRALHLPERDQFKQLIEEISAGSSWGEKAANLVEFLAYSGVRLYTEAQWVTWEDVDWNRKEIIIRGHPETGTKNWEVRRLPILPDMQNLLNRMQPHQQKRTGKLLEVIECPISLKKSCIKLGIPKLRHHDLRHLFATRCIESGVDIPTVARWLGHKDGGALAMRTYGHLRNEHSQQMAQKVKF